MIGVPPRQFGYGEGEFPVILQSGREWHSSAIPLAAGDTLTITIIGNDRFYAGLFSREAYVRFRGAGPAGAFGFNFGADRVTWTNRIQVRESDDWYLVIRVGTFTPGMTNLRIRWTRTQAPRP